MQKRKFKKKLFTVITFAPYNKQIDELTYPEFSKALSKWMRLNLSKIKRKNKLKVKSVDINWGEGELEIVDLNGNYHYVKIQCKFLISDDGEIHNFWDHHRPNKYRDFLSFGKSKFQIKYSKHKQTVNYDGKFIWVSNGFRNEYTKFPRFRYNVEYNHVSEVPNE